MSLYTSPGPIKATTLLETLLTSNALSEQQQLDHDNHGMTAIMAILKMDPNLSEGAGPQPSNKKVKRKKAIRVLLDSGSDGDLLFHKKGTTKHFPYLTRQVPKSWCMLNGTFQTKGKASIQVKFFEYSNSYMATPDVVEYDKKTMGKSVFDLILGTKTMTELGIKLDFKEQLITIDEIELPMRSINQLPTSKRKALNLLNSLAKSKEPQSTAEATHCVV